MQAAHYRVRVLPQAHELAVTLRLPSVSGTVELEVPTWVPGAYGFMKYGRDLFEVRAQEGGKPLTVARNGWQGYTVSGVVDEVVIDYRCFAHDAAWGELTGLVDHTQAVLLATRQLFAPAHKGPCVVEYELPEGWPLHHPAGARALGERTFEYPSFSAWLDTPVVAGAFDSYSRDSHGVRFDFVFLDRAVGFDSELPAFLDSVMAVVSECHRYFGSFPFERYSFVFSFSPKAHWGLEHANATMIGLGVNALIDDQEWFKAIRVCAHELFHAWNVCRLKPAPLGAPDHAHGSFPDALWVAEGFTRYYEFVLSARAGESTAARFFSNVVNYHRHLTALPAYRRVSALDSSLTTFLNHSRYPGSVNNTVDYYDLGMLIAFDLDATLRLSGPGAAQGPSLDTEFAAFYRAQAGKGAGFTSAQLRAFFSARQPALDPILARDVEQAGALGTVALLEQLGFKVRTETLRCLGLVLSEDKGPVVADVLDDGAASAAGVAPGDQILQAGGHSFDLAALRFLIGQGRPVTLEVLRGHRRFTLTVPPGERTQIAALVWEGSDDQTARLETWLGKCDLARGEPVPLRDYDNFHGIQTVI